MCSLTVLHAGRLKRNVFRDIQRQSGARRRFRRGTLFLIAVLSVFSGSSQESIALESAAKKKLAQMREQARAARDSGDKHAYLQAVLALQRFLNDRPSTIEAA